MGDRIAASAVNLIYYSVRSIFAFDIIHYYSRAGLAERDRDAPTKPELTPVTSAFCRAKGL